MPRLVELPEPVGIFTRTQLRHAGWSLQTIDARVRRGRWQRLLPGVYASYTGRLTEADVLRAALAWAGPRAVLTGESVLRLLGCIYLDQPRPHVLLMHTRSERRPPLIRPGDQPALPAPQARRGWTVAAPSSGPVLLLTRTTRAMSTTRIRGLPCASLPRVAVDAALHITGLRQTRALFCEAVQRGLVRTGQLRAEVLRRSDTRLTVAMRVLEDLAAGCASAPECELRDLVLTSRLLPPPHVNLRLSDVGGPLGYIGDLVWPEARLVVEVDSVEHHGIGQAADDTGRRRNVLTAAGWTVISVTPRDIRRDEARILALLERSYAAGLVAGR